MYLRRPNYILKQEEVSGNELKVMNLDEFDVWTYLRSELFVIVQELRYDATALMFLE